MSTPTAAGSIPPRPTSANRSRPHPRTHRLPSSLQCQTARVLVVRGTKKLRDRVKGREAAEGDASTTALGDWFGTALFWKPQAVLLVSRRTFLPVFLPLAPAATLLDRVPAAIEAILRLHGVDDSFLAAEI